MFFDALLHRIIHKRFLYKIRYIFFFLVLENSILCRVRERILACLCKVLIAKPFFDVMTSVSPLLNLHPLPGLLSTFF